MTRPSDIPADVWEAAGRALGSPDMSRDRVRKRVARAIISERERAATVADDVGETALVKSKKEFENRGPSDEWSNLASEYHAAVNIAAVIRSGK